MNAKQEYKAAYGYYRGCCHAGDILHGNSMKTLTAGKYGLYGQKAIESRENRTIRRNARSTDLPDVNRICRRLGERYERASLKRDYTAMLDLEKHIEALSQQHNNEPFLGWLMVQGRNVIRRLHGLEEFNV